MMDGAFTFPPLPRRRRRRIPFPDSFFGKKKDAGEGSHEANTSGESCLMCHRLRDTVKCTDMAIKVCHRFRDPASLPPLSAVMSSRNFFAHLWWFIQGRVVLQALHKKWSWFCYISHLPIQMPGSKGSWNAFSDIPSAWTVGLQYQKTCSWNLFGGACFIFNSFFGYPVHASCHLHCSSSLQENPPWSNIQFGKLTRLIPDRWWPFFWTKLDPPMQARPSLPAVAHSDIWY